MATKYRDGIFINLTSLIPDPASFVAAPVVIIVHDVRLLDR